MLDEYQKKFLSLFKENSRRYQPHDVFHDFCELAALSISNSVDRTRYDTREARYMKIIGKYQKSEITRFPQMLACVVNSLELGNKDCLGEIFMSLELGNRWKGQFFTPYHIACLMGQVTLSGAAAIIQEKGYITMQEPAVGAGAMVIGAAQVLHDMGINYQQKMHVTATDISVTACHMAYIHFSLLHIPAIVIHGNSLSMEEWDFFVTPAHVLGFWDGRLCEDKRGQEECAQEAETTQLEQQRKIIVAERQEQLALAF